jgi:uncharacterized protein YoxC
MDTQLFAVAISVFVFALALVVLALTYYLIPTIKQITETIRSTKELLTTVDGGIKPLLEEITTSVEKVNNMLAEIELAVEHVKDFSGAISEAGKHLHNINEILKDTGDSMSKKTSRFGAGLKTAFSVISKVVARGEKKHDKEEQGREDEGNEK